MADPTTPAPETTEPTAPETAPVEDVNDQVDYAALERRFGIKRMHPKEETPLSENTGEPTPGSPATDDTNLAGTGERPPESPAAPPTIKAKVDGKEIELNVNETFPEFAEQWATLTDQQKNRILAMHQKDLAASKRFEQANLTRKQMEQLIHAMKVDPIAVLSHPSLNHNVRQLVEEWLVKQIDFENMDPKDKELHEAKEKIRVAEEKERKAKEAAERGEMDVLAQQYSKSYQKEIIDAIETSGLPKSTETVARLAYYLRQALNPRDGKPGVRLKALDVVDLVRDDYQRMMKRLVGQADIDTLIKLFGDDFTEKMRKHLLKPIKKTGETPPAQPPANSPRGKTRRLNKEEWKALIEKNVSS